MSEKRNAPARLVDSIIDATVPGSFKLWTGIDNRGMTFVCPCGCGGLGGVSFGDGRWSWNESVEAPTVSPSIHQLNCGWHGWLTDGVFLEC